MQPATIPFRWFDAHTHQASHTSDVLALRSLAVGHDAESPHQLAYCSVGLHPWYLTNSESSFDILRQWATLPNVLAIGECGLDRLTTAPFSLQQSIFEQQIQLAEQVQKPVIIHCVRAVADVVALRNAHQPQQPWVFHGYNLRMSQLEPLLSADVHISLGAALLRPESPAARALPHIPLNRLFLETDDRTVAISAIYEAAASVLALSAATLREEIWANAVEVFGAQGLVSSEEPAPIH